MENQDSVCFIGKIQEINNIEGADKIVQSIISGWECVIAKDSYKVGDLVVIATTDAVIPFELAERLGVTTYLKNRKKTNQYTVKTTKLRGVYSSALIVDLGNTDTKSVYREGDDMMKGYGIYKYEEPAVQLITSSGKKVRYHKNPNFHIYYKFPNAKNAPDMFSEDDDVVITRKLHGSNGRWGVLKKSKLSLWDRVKQLFGTKWIEYSYCYGSHNVEKGSDSEGFYSSDIWRTIAEKYDLRNILWDYVKRSGKNKIGEGIILYGEIYGPGVQSYYTYTKSDIEVAFFDIKINGEYISDRNFTEIINNLQLPKVPYLYKGKFNKDAVDNFMKDYISETKIPHEGVICKDISGNRDKICKYISPLYLEFQSKRDDSTDFH